jgi:phosphomannomutase/phosphoglucomutase
MQIDRSIFKAYDIRGIVDRTLTVEAVRAIGLALGTLARRRGIDRAVVGRDGRLSGPKLAGALSEGFRDAGVSVIDIGQVTTPIVYYATYELGTGTGVAVTGSHNPPEYNGLKMMVGGEALYGDAILALAASISAGEFQPVAAAQRGGHETVDLGQRYLDRVTGDVKLARPMKIAIDCGNGVAARSRPRCSARSAARSPNCSARWTAPSRTTIRIRPTPRTSWTCSAACARPMPNWGSRSTATATGWAW